MQKTYTYSFLIFLVAFNVAKAQLDKIRTASSNHGSSSGTSSVAGNSDSFNSVATVSNLFFDVIMFSGVVHAQQQRLQRKTEIPGVISLDLMLQGAVQPSTYYIVNPRIRANWGIFSTDFRINYLIEEDIDEIKHIRTNDWQILQLNLIATKTVNFRVGGGILHESFSGGKTFDEWTVGLHIHPFGRKLGGLVEYRGSEPRQEINGHIEYKFFDKGILHGFGTAGIIFQRYYHLVNTWGMQGGIVLKLY